MFCIYFNEFPKYNSETKSCITKDFIITAFIVILIYQLDNLHNDFWLKYIFWTWKKSFSSYSEKNFHKNWLWTFINVKRKYNTDSFFDKKLVKIYSTTNLKIINEYLS